MQPGRGVYAVAALAAVLAATQAGCTRSVAEQRPAPSISPTGPTPSVSPVLLKDCWVPTSSGNVSLTGEQARQLTTEAADLGRRSLRADQVAARLATTVSITVGVVATVAREMADALAGLPGKPRLVCSYARAAAEPQEPGPSGLVPPARQLRAAWTEVFGPLIAGGFARGGVSSGHVDGSAHYEGRAIDVFFRPLDDREQRRRGWVFAQWLVAHAPDHQVLSIIYADHIWTSWAAYAGWRGYVPGATFRNRGNAVLRHLDHVHVAVESGRPYNGR